MATDDFVVKLNAEGNAVESVTRNGKEIKLSDDNQDYCDFLTWAGQQSDEQVWKSSRYLRADFFTERARLVEHCKRNGVILAIQRDSSPVIFDYSVGGHDAFGLKFNALNVCEAKPDEYSLRQVPSGIITSRSDPTIWVTNALLDTANSELPDEASDIRRLSEWPIERAFVYIDVSDFSTYPPGKQALIINSIQRIVSTDDWWRQYGVRDEIEAMLCIGDGFIFVVRDAVKATAFAAGLAHRIEFMVAKEDIPKEELPVEFHFRMGVHVGEVYCFWDLGRGQQRNSDDEKTDDEKTDDEIRGDWNYIGDGINGGNRVLSAIGKGTDDVLFISGAVRKKLMDSPFTNDKKDLIDNLHNRGRRKDKHGKPWRVYEVNHTAAKWARIPDVLSDRSDKC